MSRQLKFQAWFDGHMYEIANLDFWGDPDQATCDMVRKSLTEDGDVEEIFEVYLHEVELMQYTGLKDQHGKEIYDGYILRAFKHNEIEFIAEVKERNGCYWFLNWNWIEFQNIFRNIEVIGNIHENPGLLQEDADDPS